MSASTGAKVIDLMEALKASLAGRQSTGEVYVTGDHGARFLIESEQSDRIIIRDLGPWDQHPTVTNDAERVVATLADELEGRRLFYYDSDGQLDEILIDASKQFAGFAPGER